MSPLSSITERQRGTLRQGLRRRRSQLPPDEAGAAARAACTRLAAAPEFRSAGRIAGYVAVRGELDPRAALDLAHAAGKGVFLPRVRDDGSLSFLPWDPASPLRKNRYGIPEPDLPSARFLPPDELDLVIVPLVAFDRTGARLGTGAGYYDRSFAFRRTARRATPVLAGFGYAFQECPALAAAEWDVPLDLIVTEKELVRTGSAGD